MHQLLVKNVSKIRLMEQEQLEMNQQKILQICGSSGEIVIDHIQKRENGIQVEGVLNVHILYTTTDDMMPFAHTGSHVPFEQFVEIPELDEESHVWLNHGVEQLQVNLLDNSEYEVKAMLEIAVLSTQQMELSNILNYLKVKISRLPSAHRLRSKILILF